MEAQGFLEFETFNEKLQFSRVLSAVLMGSSSKKSGSGVIGHSDYNCNDQSNVRFIRTVRLSSQKYSFRGRGGKGRFNR